MKKIFQHCLLSSFILLVIIPAKAQPEQVEIAYMTNFTTGNWVSLSSLPEEALPLNSISGDNMGGIITLGGKDNRVLYYMDNYALNKWNKIIEPPIENIKYLTGSAFKGPIIANDLQIAFLKDFKHPQWVTLGLTPPFPIIGLTGENIRGPVIYGGERKNQIAYLEWAFIDDPKPEAKWRWTTVSARCPFQISGFRGNVRGVVTFGGQNDTEVAVWIQHKGWRKLKNAPEPVKSIGGEILYGIILLPKSTNSYFYIMTDFKSNRWKKIDSRYNKSFTLTGENRYGIIRYGKI